MTEPPIRHMLVLRNMTCGHYFMASISRRQLQIVQAELVTQRHRRDFRIQTVTADRAAGALLDLNHGVHCATCKIDDPPATQPEGPN